MSLAEIARRRLAQQHISQQRFSTPVEVLAWLGAIQGQDYSGAKWSLGLRLPGSTDAEIEQDIAQQRILRTWAMRGTLHLIAAADVRWLVSLLAPRLIAQNAFRYRQLELDEATLVRSTAVLVQALEGGKQLNRRDLYAVLEQHGISTEGQRGIHMLQRASLEGWLVHGTMQGVHPRFMLSAEVLPATPTLTREESLAELATRYFRSRGPATLPDFASWSGLAMGEVRAGIEAIKSSLLVEQIEQQTYYAAPAPPLPPLAAAAIAYAPPGFDEYLLGYADRSAVLDPQYATLVCPGKNGIFFPTIVMNGRVVGVWKRSVKKAHLIIAPAPFQPLTDAEQAAFALAIQRFGAFHQQPTVIS
jgi:Winged helix DNA-binding domain